MVEGGKREWEEVGMRVVFLGESGWRSKDGNMRVWMGYGLFLWCNANGVDRWIGLSA